jgi:sulfatase maturation enzyme AslB (radical SAM superfamily)
MINQQLVNEIKELRKKLPTHFCPVPFTTIILEPDGKVGLCRNKGNDFPVGQLSFTNFDEIWTILNSEKAKKWRSEFLEGNPLICQEEVTTRKCNLDLHFNDLLPQAELKSELSHRVLRLTANLNGKCNMHCPFCTIWTLPNNNYTDDNFWVPAKKLLFPQLKQIDMLSGEPFIQADTYKLIDQVTEVNASCEWIFTTNMYWMLSDKIKEKLDKIVIKNISVSIDSFDKTTYARLRPPGDINITLRNLDLLLRYREERKLKNRNFTLSFNFLLQKDNWKELPEIYRFARKNDMEFVVILLTTPKSFSILDLSPQEREAIFNYFLENIEPKHLFKLNPLLMPLAESLTPIEKARYLNLITSPKAN